MRDFTPTTEQVRDGYRFDPEDEYRDPVGAPMRATRAGWAFDRWLAAHDAELRNQIVRELIPSVAHNVHYDTDIDMLSRAADNLDHGYPLGGGNITSAVAKLIHNVVAFARKDLA